MISECSSQRYGWLAGLTTKLVVYAFPMVNVTRPDAVRPSLAHEDAMRNAPGQANDLFMVPKIVE